MTSRLAILIASVVLSPIVAGAGTLHPSLGGRVEYDPNVFRSQTNEQDDVIFTLTPALRLSEQTERLTMDLRYGVPVERGVSTNTEIEFDHTPQASLTYRISPRMRLAMDDRFRYSEIIDQNPAQIEDETTGEFLTITQERDETVIQNIFDATLSRQFSGRVTGTLGVDHDLFDSTASDRSDNQSFGARTSLAYRFSGSHTFNGGLSVRRQIFDERTDSQGVTNFEGSQTDFFSANFGWSWLIDESTSLTIRISPTFVMSEEDRPDPVQTVPLYSFSVLDRAVVIRNRRNPLDPGPNSAPNRQDVVAPAGSIAYNPIGGCPQLGGTPVQSSCQSSFLINDPVNFPDETSAIATILAGESVDAMFTTPPNPESSESFTLFGGVTLTRRWSPRFNTSFNYTRRESTASGLAGSTTLDSVSLTNRWRMTELWTLAFRSDFTLRESISDRNRTFVALDSDAAAFPQFDTSDTAAFLPAQRVDGAGGLVSATTDDAVNTRRWGVSGTLSRQITQRLVGRLNARYSEQTSKRGSTGATSDFDQYLVGVSFTYSFEPIQLW